MVTKDVKMLPFRSATLLAVDVTVSKVLVRENDRVYAKTQLLKFLRAVRILHFYQNVPEGGKDSRKWRKKAAGAHAHLDLSIQLAPKQNKTTYQSMLQKKLRKTIQVETHKIISMLCTTMWKPPSDKKVVLEAPKMGDTFRAENWWRRKGPPQSRCWGFSHICCICIRGGNIETFSLASPKDKWALLCWWTLVKGEVHHHNKCGC